ncbi:MAG: MFS transporter [Vulcanisaeta sp.]|nr:MFS transporter [Vulcanisaeta moutnovskia]
MNSQGLPKRSTYTVLSAMGYFLDGYDLSVISVFTYALLQFKFWHYTSLELGFVSGAALLGAMVGAIIFGHYSDRLGRRYLYVWDLLFFVIFAILSAIANDIIQLIIFRFFVGWGVGADYSLSPVYATEMYPTGRRGMGYGWVWSFWSIGALVSFLIGYYLYIWNPIIGWRWALGLGAIPALITVVLRASMPESSRWRVAVQGTEDAVTEAKRLSVVTGLTEEELSKLIEIERKLMDQVRPGDWRWLFRGDFAKRTAIVWTQWILYDIGSYGFGLYSPAILAMLGFKGALAILLSSLLYVPGFLGALGAAFLNDVWGRRRLQLIGFGGSALGMLFVALAAIWQSAFALLALVIGVTGLILWYGIGNLGPGNTMGLYAIELFPTKLRSTSMGSATAITRFVSFLSAFEFPYIALAIGKLTFFEFLFAITFIAFIFTIFFTPETKGIPLELIAIARTRAPSLHPRLEIPSIERH